jgi:glycosyltransferase involved in cell wall biosynthesis
MKILYLNGADNEGGAAKAATRLLDGIRAQGAEASLYVQRKFGDAPFVEGPESRFGKIMGFARPTLEQTILGISPAKVKGPFSAAYLPDGLLPRIEKFAPDILHLHWVARMMRIETLGRVQVPIVWTMHDSWAFTGGCYLPFDCTRYQGSCGGCPILGSSTEEDLSRRVWKRKLQAWANLNLTLVAPSRWLAGKARESSLFRDAQIEVIPNGIDVERYKPLEKTAAREKLSLPQDKKLVLFGAKGALSDRNKGFLHLQKALGELAAGPGRDDVELVVFGAAAPSHAPELGFKTHYTGWQHDDVSLALLYAAADVFVLPSISENLPYTVMEAMSCGTPCVGFDQGGVADLIDHRRNGYLAKAYEATDLGRGIAWVLENPERRKQLSVEGRGKVLQQYAEGRVTLRYMELYRRVGSGPRFRT